jgi:hypothetical protein
MRSWKGSGERMEWGITVSINPGHLTFELDPGLLTLPDIMDWVEWHVEWHVLRMVMYECDGNQSEMARRLGVCRMTVLRMCERYGLETEIAHIRRVISDKRRKRNEGRSRD